MVIKVVRKWMVFVVLGLLVFGTSYLAAADRSHGECRAEGEEHGDHGSSSSSNGYTHEEKMCMMAENSHMFGKLESDTENHSFNGRFIEFTLPGGNDSLEGYTVKAEERAVVFDRVVWGEVSGASYSAEGAHFRFTSEEVKVDAHNNLAAILMVRVYDSREVVYTLPEGSAYTVNGGFVNITAGGLEGVLMYFNSTLQTNGSRLSFTPTSVPYHIIFRAIPTAPGDCYRWERSYSRSLFTRRALGEVRMAIGEGGHMGEMFSYREDVRMEVREADRSRVRMMISGEGEGGVMLLQMNRDALGRGYKVYLDGDEVKEAGDINEVLEAQGREPLYYGESTEEGSRYLALYIPHFSTHTLEIVKEGERIDYLIYAAVVVILLLSVALLLLLRRKQ